MKILITLLKPLSFLPALLMMYIIFSFSAQPGEVSGSLSYKISYEIIETKSELLSENLSSEEIAYKALPADLVDEVRVDVGDMKIGDVIRVKDLPIYADKKITIMTDPDAVVVALNAAHNAAVPETETAETEEEPKKDE